MREDPFVKFKRQRQLTVIPTKRRTTLPTNELRAEQRLGWLGTTPVTLTHFVDDLWYATVAGIKGTFVSELDPLVRFKVEAELIK